MNNTLIKGRILFLVNQIQQIGNKAQEHYLDCQLCVEMGLCNKMEGLTTKHANTLVRVHELENLLENKDKWKNVK